MKTSTNIKVKETGFSFRKNDVGQTHYYINALKYYKKKKKEVTTSISCMHLKSTNQADWIL